MPCSCGAYVERWARRLRKDPAKLSVDRARMSAAIERHPVILAALHEGWMNHGALSRAADQVGPFPVLQLSLLKALKASGQARHNRQAIRKIRDEANTGNVFYLANALLL